MRTALGLIKQILFANHPRRDQMVILQDSARILQKTVILQDSGRKMVILQDLPEKWLSCKICKKRGLIVKKVITV